MKKLPIYLFVILVLALSVSPGFSFDNPRPQKPFSIDSIQSPFCEGFNGFTFPPTGWIVVDPLMVIHRALVSGFGLGQGSVYYDFWYATPGYSADLITPVFTASIPGDSIGFDLAYCSTGAHDILGLYYSTNGGYSFNVIDSQLIADPWPPGGCTRPFIPTASQWMRKNFALPLGTDIIKFHAIAGIGIGDDIYLDSICVEHIVGIKSNNNNVPNSFHLYQNYPNPFNPSTRIKFDITPLSNEIGEGQGVRNVTLNIYDILGREVATLVNEKLNPGTYEVEFNGSDFPSGVYFYELTAGDFTQSKRMVLLK